MTNYDNKNLDCNNNHTLREGELSSSEATISCVDISGFHCKTEHLLLFGSEKLLIIGDGNKDKVKLKMRKEDVALTTGNQVTSNYVLALLWAFAVSSPRQLEIKHKKQKKNVSIPLPPQPN